MPPPPKLSSLFPPPPSLLLLSLLLSVLLLFSLHHPSSQTTPPSHSQTTPPPNPFHLLFSSLSSNSSLSSHLRHLTSHPHLAGDPSTSSYLLHHLRLSSIPTSTSNFTPLLSFPLSSSLSLLHPNLTLLKLLPLSEPSDPDTIFIPPYHAFSPSGRAVGPAVFVNFGRNQDYEKLNSLGVSVKGCVVVVRRGVGPRGAVVEKAAERGALGVLMYTEGMEGGVERGMVLIGESGDLVTSGRRGGGGGWWGD